MIDIIRDEQLDAEIDRLLAQSDALVNERLDAIADELALSPERTIIDGRQRVCRGCGCTDARACPGGCYWAAPGLCSRCA